MIVKKFGTGMLGSNCFILSQDNIGVCIDPGVSDETIIDYLNKNNIELKYIILTHAHIDHILYMDKLKEKTNAKTVVHELDNDALTDKHKNGAMLFGLDRTFNKCDITVKDNDILKFNNMDIKVISTPGHTPGGISIYVDNYIFTGDTLFYMSVGRTDLGRGDQRDLEHSIKHKLLNLPDNTIVCTGHGKDSTIGFEKKNNPFIY